MNVNGFQPLREILPQAVWRLGHNSACWATVQLTFERLLPSPQKAESPIGCKGYFSSQYNPSFSYCKTIPKFSCAESCNKLRCSLHFFKQDPHSPVANHSPLSLKTFSSLPLLHTLFPNLLCFHILKLLLHTDASCCPPNEEPALLIWTWTSAVGAAGGHTNQHQTHPKLRCKMNSPLDASHLPLVPAVPHIFRIPPLLQSPVQGCSSCVWYRTWCLCCMEWGCDKLQPAMFVSYWQPIASTSLLSHTMTRWMSKIRSPGQENALIKIVIKVVEEQPMEKRESGTSKAKFVKTHSWHQSSKCPDGLPSTSEKIYQEKSGNTGYKKGEFRTVEPCMGRDYHWESAIIYVIWVIQTVYCWVKRWRVAPHESLGF